MRVYTRDGDYCVVSVVLGASTSQILVQVQAAWQNASGANVQLNDARRLYIVRNGMSGAHSCFFCFRLLTQAKERELSPSEFPGRIQLQLLSQFGYDVASGLMEACAEDHSYMFRFIASDYPEAPSEDFVLAGDSTVADLSGRNLVAPPTSLVDAAKAGSLLSLDISSNPSLYLDDALVKSCASTLKQLTANDNNLTELPASIGWLGSLVSLRAARNRLHSLPSLSNLEQLRFLDLRRNSLSTLPDDLSALKQLAVLNVASNAFDAIPASATRLGTLIEADFSFNSLKTLPASFDGWTGSLRSLLVAGNSLADLPKSIATLKSLVELDIRHNAITDVSLLKGLRSLTLLLADDNRITTAFAVSSLDAYSFSHNPISSVECILSLAPTPPSVSPGDMEPPSKPLARSRAQKRLPSSKRTSTITASTHSSQGTSSTLSSLSSGGSASSLSASSTLANPSMHRARSLLQLDRLHLRNESSPMLVHSPLSTARFSNSFSFISSLSMAHGVLREFPEALFQISTLLQLDFSYNRISAFSVPKACASTSQLQILNLSHNRLTALPASIDALTHLASLDVSDNQLAALPACLWTLPLTTLNASVNALTAFPEPPLSTSNISMSTPSSSASSFASWAIVDSLAHLLLSFNRFTGASLAPLAHLTNVELLSVSQNPLQGDLPAWVGSLGGSLEALHMSHCELTSAPDDVLDRLRALRILDLSCNRLTVLPAALAKVKSLQSVDVHDNALKYDVMNWSDGWNWNWNVELRHLDLSYNSSLLIVASKFGALEGFAACERLEFLGLSGVQLKAGTAVPVALKRHGRVRRQQASRTVRFATANSPWTSSSTTIWDASVPHFRRSQTEHFFAVIDSTDATLARFLADRLPIVFAAELARLSENLTALAARRTFLLLNDEVCNFPPNAPHSASAVVAYLRGDYLVLGHVGGARALLVSRREPASLPTQYNDHTPSSRSEARRMIQAGGCLDRNSSLRTGDVEVSAVGLSRAPSESDASVASLDSNAAPGSHLHELRSSRAFGMASLVPIINANPFVVELHVDAATDDLLVLASQELWDHVSDGEVSSTCRLAMATTHADPDRALATDEACARVASAVRDLAIAHGAKDELAVTVISLRRLGLASLPPSGSGSSGSAQMLKPSPSLNVDKAPIGRVALVFTDIKGSTSLWERDAIAMHDAILVHNRIMRELLAEVGGYEVKTEGDAFMLAFWSVRDALEWCTRVQMALLEEPSWPAAVLAAPVGLERRGPDGVLLYRGVSVRMGIHVGAPVAEPDPTTGRMDYFGPVVNRAARVCSAADGGQIFVSMDAWEEAEDGLDELAARNVTVYARDIGEYVLKGLETPQHLWVVYPNAVAERDAFAVVGGGTKEEKLDLTNYYTSMPASEVAIERWPCIHATDGLPKEAAKCDLIFNGFC